MSNVVLPPPPLPAFCVAALGLALAMPAGPAFAAGAGSERVDTVRAAFISRATMGWPSFQVSSRQKPTSERAAFFARALGLDAGQVRQVVAEDDLLVRQSGEGDALQLGVAELRLESEEEAKRISVNSSDQTPDFFDNTKILTRFVACRHDSHITVVFSETFIDTRVTRFLAGFPELMGDLCDVRS